MVTPSGGNGSSPGIPCADHVRELFWRTLGRLILLYFVPLLLLGIFFQGQYRRLVRDSQRAHLEVVAHHQANTFDLFLRERLVNLGNIVDAPGFRSAGAPAGGPNEGELSTWLAAVRQTSEAFVDLATVSATGDLLSYVGPVRYAPGVSYADEAWFRELLAPGRRSVITGIYRGVRDLPHFTIAVRAGQGAEALILRAALSPERLSEYLATLEGANEVHAAIVDAQGVLQVTTPRVGEVLLPSPFVPPPTPERGLVRAAPADGRPEYAYAWLRETPWALVVTNARTQVVGGFLSLGGALYLVTGGLLAAVAAVILVRTRQVVGRQLATERYEADLSGQLVHAAKLASVGELAAGIAHEINNPLAIVAEEVGLLEDSLDPELSSPDDEPLDLRDHLDAIHDAVFRCRDITRKLLTFVRQSDVKVEAHDLADILDDVLDPMLGNELAISNVTVERDYAPAMPPVLADRNQVVQVFVNLVKNALDAMPDGGALRVFTSRRGTRATVSVRDTGCGMTPDQVERVFMPFFTTKEPGKGTGLGLSVSYGIIHSLGGEFYVESAPGRGSTFTVELPLAVDPGPGPDAAAHPERGTISYRTGSPARP